ncbi:glycoside hydrolase family 15 protein [Marinivivus vitaminiproducens]|uniref:glycoside hydrolase family 15 protein n=1 Tax=Marinivivus vitaminiproducens TaxID=3035935 RepID=UPI0027A868BC|nr:glycoside hydrolase family 15 protein [Geminicoccaceae bacterium SCSIO 64248]
MSTLDLGLIGNCTISALIDQQARIVWSCFPRLDGDPLFYRLVDNDGEHGLFGIEMAGCVRTEQAYEPHTAVLVTKLLDEDGHGVEITDFCPRSMRFGRVFHPTMIVRMLRPIGKVPLIRVRVRPRYGYGTQVPEITRGSNHIRYVGADQAVRLTTNAPVVYILDETEFRLETPVSFLLGPDESLRDAVQETARAFLEQTTDYWQTLSMRLQIPFEWQDAVIRSAITLKLCTFEETGAIVAAMTTSLPEADGETRNWDYRFSWLRDSLFVVRALNRLGYVETMESYLIYLRNIVGMSEDGYLQPVFGLALETKLIEREIETLAGYRGNRPVRVGNQAYEHDQHDGYGSVVLSASQAFYDSRLRRPAGEHTFHQLERVGEQAYARYNRPDAGLWEFRSFAHVHTHSAVMCWAACDRLAKIAGRLGLTERDAHWRSRAQEIRKTILERAWNREMNSFTAAFGGKEVDAGLLLLHEVGFVKATDPRFAGTVAAIERDLKHGPFLKRYRHEDDFGEPKNAFLVCSFWYIDALAAMGRRDEARELFERILSYCNHVGLLAEHVSIADGSLWGNFPQTYSHVGLIYCAMKLSRPWDDRV